jgi:hypothetical protein
LRFLFFHLVKQSLSILASDHLSHPIHMSDTSLSETEDGRTMSVIRSVLLVILILGIVGTGVELLLIEHTADVRQWIPLLLILSSLCVLGWRAVAGGAWSLRFFRGVMVGFVGAGFLGFYFHYNGSVEFRLESDPSLKGWALFWQAMRGKAPPPLAPGIMIQLGLIGLAYAYRHPAMSSSISDPESKGE